jgi:ferredoxin--NADP+ reductase
VSDSPVRIAVVGAGPAGFYAAGHLLKDSDGRIEVDMLERLPTPWGLVRSGVAPDHPKIKSVTRIYEKTAAHPRFRYFGNVELGSHVTREELLAHYHAIVYATGSPADRPLGIPGEELRGSWAATDFVGWYNGHPDHPDLQFDLACERAVVIGNGNVALDVARMLVLSHEELSLTDIADHALHALEHSGVREVVVLGRRGPAQAAFTNPELLELGELTGADVVVDPAELERALAVPDTAVGKTAEGNVRILRDYATRPSRGEPRRVVLRFLLSPVELLGDEQGHLRAVELVRNELIATPGGGLRAQPTEERLTVEAGLAFRAIGYRGTALPGVPFDERSAVIPNRGGRVLDPNSGEPLPGEYVVGWIKRGPTGVIGTNKRDAQETVDAILEDLAPLLDPARSSAMRNGASADRTHVPSQADAAAVDALLRERQPQLVTYSGWQAIDRHERALGEPAGRPRVKLTRLEQLLEVAAEEEP